MQAQRSNGARSSATPVPAHLSPTHSSAHAVSDVTSAGARSHSPVSSGSLAEPNAIVAASRNADLAQRSTGNAPNLASQPPCFGDVNGAAAFVPRIAFKLGVPANAASDAPKAAAEEGESVEPTQVDTDLESKADKQPFAGIPLEDVPPGSPVSSQDADDRLDAVAAAPDVAKQHRNGVLHANAVPPLPQADAMDVEALTDASAPLSDVTDPAQSAPAPGKGRWDARPDDAAAATSSRQCNDAAPVSSSMSDHRSDSAARSRRGDSPPSKRRRGDVATDRAHDRSLARSKHARTDAESGDVADSKCKRAQHATGTRAARRRHQRQSPPPGRSGDVAGPVAQPPVAEEEPLTPDSSQAAQRGAVSRPPQPAGPQDADMSPLTSEDEGPAAAPAPAAKPSDAPLPRNGMLHGHGSTTNGLAVEVEPLTPPESAHMADFCLCVT